MNNVTELYPRSKVVEPKELTEKLLQALLDGVTALGIHLDKFPRSIDHVRWVAKEGDPGCQGAAVVVALLEKRVSGIKARIINR